MRITRLWVDGYGRFSGRELPLSPGLQVIAGPNERGKSTIRGFICEMLYGQKRSSSQRVYDATHELRIPWNKSATYGGRIEYQLDDGTVIEVQRNFDKADEMIKVFDRTNAEDITSDFPMLRNRELLFADWHVGIPRSVFLGVATISHSSLSELGDDAALARIREKLVSMTDSGDTDHSTESALKWLNMRIASIGQKTARKRPLPMVRARLVDLQKEYAEVRLARSDAAHLEAERVELFEQIAALEERQGETTAALGRVEWRNRSERLRKAEAALARVDEITKTCFALGDVRDFPVHELDAVRELAPKADAAERQVALLDEERRNLQAKIEAESAKIGSADAAEMDDPDPDAEERLADLDAAIRRLSERIVEVEQAIGSLEQGAEDCRKKLEGLPDFARLAADPVEWLTQLASSFNVARKTRDTEIEQRSKLYAGVQERQAEVAKPKEAFSRCDDFPALARAYTSTLNQKSETLIRLEREAELLHGTVDDLESRVPELMVYTSASVLFAVLTLVMRYLIPNNGIFIPTAMLGIMAVFLGGMAVVSRGKIRRAMARLDEIETEERGVIANEAEGRGQIEDLLKIFGCESVRELEAIYDRYRQNTLDLNILQERLEAQEMQTKESEDRVSALFDRIKSTFLSVGQTLETEDQVQEVAMRAISRYQEYRESKRRANEIRDLLKVRREELETLKERLEDLRQKERDVALGVRQFMRDNHYPEEAKSGSALTALRGYRMRVAQVRQRRSQLDSYIDRLELLNQRLPEEQAHVAALRDELSRLIGHSGAEDLNSYKETADRAVQFRDLRKELAGLEDQLGVILNGQDIHQLRAAVAEGAGADDMDGRSTEELRQDLQRMREDIEALRKSEHAVHLAITERLAGLRPLNEVEEEREAMSHRMQELELELQAATYAMSVLEEVTRERHSRVAPRLANRASEYLAEITDGAYTELLINRDLQVRVRVPETKTLHDQPEQALSRGTVDQIYLALRLAMVEALSDGSECVPMLLDDPFANYDDARLERSMQLLQRLSDRHQILFFTCRDDVVQAAEAAGAPIIHL